MPQRLASRRLASRRLAARVIRDPSAGGDVWEDTTPPSGATLGTMVLVATEESIGCDILFTEGAITVTTVTAEFRFTDESGRRDALDFWPTRPTSGNKNIYGSVVQLVAGTAYQVRARVNFSDGSHAYRIGTATTRTLAIPDPASLTYTRFVDAVNGLDTNAGTSAGAAVKTYNRIATTYPTNGTGVVRFAPGFYKSAGESLNRGAVKFIAEFPACADRDPVTGAVPLINTGNWSVLEPGAVTSPTGTGANPNGSTWVTEAPWVSVQLAGPGLYGNTPGTLYQLWKWDACPIASPTQGSYAATRLTLPPNRLAHWANVDSEWDTPEEFAENLRTNQYYTFGFWVDPLVPTTLYARLPGDLDPNTLWLWFGANQGVRFNSGGGSTRLSGFVVHTFQQNVEATGGPESLDHNFLCTAYRSVNLSGSSNTGAVIRHNRIRDTNLWDEFENQPNLNLVSWNAIKGSIRMADGTITKTGGGPTYAKPCANSETQGVYVTSGARAAIIQYNDFEGVFNGVGIPGAGANSATRTFGANTDILDNRFYGIPDDAFEPEGSAINIRIRGNDVRKCLAGLSVAPIHYGPIYLFRNMFWEIGSRGIGPGVFGPSAPSGKGIKHSNDSRPGARIYIIHNSFDIDQTDPNLLMFAGDSGGGSTRHERFWLKNNIITCTNYVIDGQDYNNYVEDYNFLCTSRADAGIRMVTEGADPDTKFDYDNTGAGKDFAAYRAATGQGTNSNLVLGVTKQINAADWLADVRAMWEDRDAGVLTLVIGAPAINRGTPIPNISDRAGIDYLGSAPDLGAFERE
jgi:hypothetical protein